MATTYRFKNSGEQAKYERLWSIVYQGAVRLRKKAMMYFAAGSKKRIYTTRGKHVAQVAAITKEMVKRFGGDEKAAILMGLGHDFGHSTLAHTGEAPLGRFMLSPDEFKEWEDLRDREGFDHSKHSLRALKKKCRAADVEIDDFVANGIEAHSTGSGVKKKDAKRPVTRQLSLEAECVMRADKIASSISDTQDMIKAGVIKSYKMPDGNLKIDENDLRECLNNPEVRKLVKLRVFDDMPSFAEKEQCAIDLLGGAEAYNEKKEEIRDKYYSRYPEFSENEIEKLVQDEVEEVIISEYLLNVGAFIQNTPGVQVERMISKIVEATFAEHNGTVVTGYRGDSYSAQLVVPKDIEAVLAAMRGLLQGKEADRSLGKEGPEVEGLVETIARYIYAHKADFENREAFQYWRTDENGKECDWKQIVAYSLAEFTDMEFKEFAIGLLEKEDVREVLKHCKYRDPRDKSEKLGGMKLEYCEADFSTEEAIEAAFTVDKDRTYRKSSFEMSH